MELPAHFDNYFNQLQRRSGQTLLSYVTEHDEALRRLAQHHVKLPASVVGWQMLRKANLSKDQHRLIMTQAGKDLTKEKVVEALYFVPGQDYKFGHDRPRGPGFKGSGFHRRHTGYWASEGDYDEPYNDVDPDGTYWHDDQTYADEIYWQDDHWDSIGDETGETDDHHEAYYGEDDESSNPWPVEEYDEV